VGYLIVSVSALIAVVAWTGQVFAAADGPPPTTAAQPEAEAAGLEAKKPGQTFQLAGHQITVKEMTFLPVVRNEYSAVFDFECFDNPKLKELRRQFDLDKVVAPGKDEFDQMVLLNAWVNKSITFGAPEKDPKGELFKQGSAAILKAAAEGTQLNCGYFATVLHDAARSLGWVARAIDLKGRESDGNGSGHSILEIWSNQQRRWVMFDPTCRLYVEKQGLPLSAVEIRQEWFYNDGRDLAFMLGAERKRYTKADLPVDLGTFKGFGKLTVNARSWGKYLFVDYTPTTKDGGPDYANMFIVTDKLSEGVKHHTRKNPKDPLREVNWPMNQAALRLTPGEGLRIMVAADTWTPNFRTFRFQVDGGQGLRGYAGAPGGRLMQWELHPGTNTLEVLAVNKFDREGAPSKVVLEVR
jgi:hypothetical protein